MMKIQLSLILFAVFNVTNSQPLRVDPSCWKSVKTTFPFFGKESVTLAEILKTAERIGLGAGVSALWKTKFQGSDRNKNGLLEIDEACVNLWFTSLNHLKKL